MRGPQFRIRTVAELLGEVLRQGEDVIPVLELRDESTQVAGEIARLLAVLDEERAQLPERQAAVGASGKERVS